MLDAMDQFDQQAFDFVTGAPAREAFDIAAETPEMRDRYGRNSWGQSVLLARRLVEAGSTFVTCHFGGWDHHWDLQSAMERRTCRKVDRLVHGLLTDLDERGLLDKRLVMLCGEFSRTPRMNDGGNGGPPMSKGTPGRDHWGNALFGAAGRRRRQGGPDRRLRPTGSANIRPIAPVRPGDIHHTIFHVLGLDPQIAFLNHAGRPIVAMDHGAVIQELV